MAIRSTLTPASGIRKWCDFRRMRKSDLKLLDELLIEGLIEIGLVQRLKFCFLAHPREVFILEVEGFLLPQAVVSGRIVRGRIRLRAVWCQPALQGTAQQFLALNKTFA